ncbi:MAG TPA: hypothetical protein VJ279_08450 [Hanamia sp.]|jgi:hypothetical protein|nr:hypothetical protein [Hanamia sp.]
MALPLTTDTEEIPVRIVGSSVFGRYPTISVERTYNMYISTSGDGEEQWLVNFPGYRAVLALIESGAEGRGTFHSVRGDFLLAVVAGDVFRINQFDEAATQIGTISTTSGDVFFAENLSSQIGFVSPGDTNAYIYNYAAFPAAISTAVFDSHASDFQPNYITYHNTYFLFGNALTSNAGSNWVVYQSGWNGTPGNEYNLTWVQTLALQTKSDFAKAVLRIPGKGNNVLVFGTTVAEIWNNVGGLRVYQRNSSINIDYGAASVATIAANEEVVAWLGINENSSPALMVMSGGGAERISTDGLDNLFERVNFPSRSAALLYRQGGHLFYILTFFDESDNFTIMYDFTTKKLFDLTDWDFTAFPARQIVYFRNKNYFLSFKDGAMYELNSDLTTYDIFVNSGDETVDQVYDIPCVRLTNTFRLPNRPEKYKVKLFTFVIESGTTPDAYNHPVCFGYILTEDTHQIIYTEDGLPILVEGGYCTTGKPRVDLTISKNGGINFSNAVSYELKATADFKNQPRFINLGYAQQITYQMRFWGSGRKVVKNGMMEIGA